MSDKIKPGASVFARRNPDHDRKYTEIARQERAQFTNKVGRIGEHSDSHGLCYEVVFTTGTAWYEPDELEVL